MGPWERGSSFGREKRERISTVWERKRPKYNVGERERFKKGRFEEKCPLSLALGMLEGGV